jgi:hypothetical protein
MVILYTRLCEQSEAIQVCSFMRLAWGSGRPHYIHLFPQALIGVYNFSIERYIGEQ